MSSLLLFNCSVYRLEIRHVGIFDLALGTAVPFNLLSVSLSPFPLSTYSLYRQCVAGTGWGCWVLLETIFCRSLTLCIWPDSEPKKLLFHSKQKPRRGGGLREINACRKVLLKVNIFRLVSILLFSRWERGKNLPSNIIPPVSLSPDNDN